MFQAILVNQNEDKTITSRIERIKTSAFSEGDVIVDIDYSSLNYKDALAITGDAPVVRSYPMIPGIDFAGTVAESDNLAWNVGDKVILNGWGVGEKHWGGLSQKAKVKGDWLIKLPEKINTYQAMVMGTAAYTAMLSVMALQRNHVKPENGEILVTGANGGVGSFAIAILSAYGYEVVASTGRLKESEYLMQLGASECIDRSEFVQAGRPLGKERWAGVVDCVGSHTLVNACATTQYNGTVTACGLAQGFDFPATVMPFILRGVTLVGIDSVSVATPIRQDAWNRLADILKPELFDRVAETVSLSNAIVIAKHLLKGEVRGRVVVDVNT